MDVGRSTSGGCPALGRMAGRHRQVTRTTQPLSAERGTEHWATSRASWGSELPGPSYHALPCDARFGQRRGSAADMRVAAGLVLGRRPSDRPEPRGIRGCAGSLKTRAGAVSPIRPMTAASLDSCILMRRPDRFSHGRQHHTHHDPSSPLLSPVGSRQAAGAHRSPPW